MLTLQAIPRIAGRNHFVPPDGVKLDCSPVGEEKAMDILYLVDRLENLIAGSRKMPLTNSIMIKESDILNIVDQMRTSIPDEIKLARRIIQDKERIIAQAQADASTLLARAREESEKAIEREGLLKAAGEQSQAMVREAEEQAEKLKTDADVYVVETLRALREHLNAIEISVSRTILSIEKGLESLEQPLEGENMDGSFAVYEEDRGEQLQAHGMPRRASLAADTMGGPAFESAPQVDRSQSIEGRGQ
jgi:hypothetical protein